MKRKLIVCLFGVVFTMLGAAQDNLIRGNATWYNTESMALAASHATLPFGTRLRVTNTKNNKQVIVTITNRIPNTPNRLIDLSREAAKNIELPNSGSTPVTIEILGGRRAAQTETPPPPPPPAPVEVAVVEKPAPPPPPPEPVGREVAPPAPLPPAPPPPEPEPKVIQQPAPAYPPPNITTQTIVTINGKEIVDITSPSPSPASVVVGPSSEPAQFMPMPPEPPRPAPSTPSVVQINPPPYYPPPSYYPPYPPPYYYPPYTPPAPPSPPPAPPTVIMPPAQQAQPQTFVMPPPTVIAPPPVITAPPVITQPPVIAAPMYPSSPLPYYSGRGGYRVQVGAFRDALHAQEAMRRLREAGFNPYYERFSDYYRIVITGIRPEEMSSVAYRLSAAGFRQVWLREEW